MEEIKKLHIEPEGVLLGADEDRENPPKENPVVRKKGRRLGKKALIAAVVLAAFVLFLGLGVVLPAKGVYESGMETVLLVKKAVRGAKDQDIAKTLTSIKEAKKSLAETKKRYKRLSWVKLVPFLGGYVKDGEHGLNAGEYGLEAAQVAAMSVEPYADLLGLKGEGSFVGGSAEERIKTAVGTLDKVVAKLDEIEKNLLLARSELAKIDPGHYPEKFRGKKIRSVMVKYLAMADEGIAGVSEAKPLLKRLPKLMGEPKEIRYLVLFQNDKELRPTGGFITGYSIFRLEHGIVHVNESGDIYDLDAKMKINIKAPEPIAKYHINVPYWHLRDSNLSPDFYESMKDFEKLYKYVEGKEDYDGIIAVDTWFLLEVLKILGPIEIEGVKYTTEKTPECNCPQVIYKLEEYADKPVGYEKKGRKDLIGVMLYALMEKALGSSPKLYWGKLFQTGLDMAVQKHILVYLKDKEAQRGIEALGFGGRIKEYDGDYLHINDTNFAGAKTNMYVKHYIEYDVEIKGDKAIKKLKITYKNPQPWSNCDLEAGELCLNGRLRDWVRIYAPKGSKLIKMVGSQIKSSNNKEFGKTYFEARVDIDPQTQRVLELEYESPITAGQSSYKLLIQKQAGTEGHEMTVRIGGKEEKFKLTADKELVFKL